MTLIGTVYGKVVCGTREQAGFGLDCLGNIAGIVNPNSYQTIEKGSNVLYVLCQTEINKSNQIKKIEQTTAYLSMR